jgi:putative redox protein
MRTVTVTWDGDADRFTAAGTHRDHEILINAPHPSPLPDGSHRPPTGFAATELLLAGAGACAAWDVVAILRKQRQAFSSLEVRVVGEQDDDPPRAYRRLTITFRVSGRALDEARVRRAVRMSLDRYCSVVATIRDHAEVVEAVEIVDGLGAPAA